MASKLKAAAGSFERILLPRLNSIDGEIKALNTKIDATNTRIDSTRSELRTEMTSNKNEIKSDIRALSEKVDILPRLAVLEAKIKELEKRS